jgi:iron complex transport system substrate-binding protein
VVTSSRRGRWRSSTASLFIASTALLLAVASFGISAQTPQRIVSIIPAVTEMLFAIGDGAQIVGVSSFDRFPPDVSRIPRVGALLDPNVERILSLKPDLVVLYATQVELKQRLDRAGIPYYSYEHRTLRDITATLRAIGARVGSSGPAARLAADIERSIASVRASVAARPRPRTLLVFEREGASLRNIYATGGFGFLHDMVDAAGGEDVFADIKQQSVQATTELILARHPDVIVELRYGDNVKTADIPREMQAWNSLASVPAVRNHRVEVLIGDQFVVPGPRVADAVRRLAEAIHPELR